MDKVWNRKNILVVILFIFCITGMFFCLVKKVEFQNVGSISYNAPSISPQIIEQAIKDREEENSEQAENIEYLLWKLKDKEMIESPSTGGVKNITVVECNGDVSLFLPMNLITGSILQKEDKIGCLIDKKTAFDLFGTVQAVGNMVVFNEKSYIVRGVFDTLEEFVLIENNDLQMMYQNMELKLKGEKSNLSKAKQIEDFLMNTPEKLIMDNGVFINITRLFYLIPSILCCFILVCKKLSCSYFVQIAICILVLFVFLFAFQIPVGIPDDFIPNQWSDFEFYSMKYKEILEKIIKISHSAPSFKIVYLKKEWMGSMVYMVAFLFSTYIARKLSSSIANKLM